MTARKALQLLPMMTCLSGSSFATHIVPDKGTFFECVCETGVPPGTTAFPHNWKYAYGTSDAVAEPLLASYDYERVLPGGIKESAHATAKAETIVGHTRTGGPLPNVKADVEVKSTNDGRASVNANADASYHFVLEPLKIPFVDIAGVVVLAQGMVETKGTTDFSGLAFATMLFDGGAYVGAPPLYCSGSNCIDSFITPTSVRGVPVVRFVNTKMQHTIKLAVKASGGASADGNGRVTASIDPEIELAPEFRDQFRIVFSPNLTPSSEIPEPSTITAIGTGVLLLWGCRKQLLHTSRTASERAKHLDVYPLIATPSDL